MTKPTLSFNESLKADLKSLPNLPIEPIGAKAFYWAMIQVFLKWTVLFSLSMSIAIFMLEKHYLGSAARGFYHLQNEFLNVIYYSGVSAFFALFFLCQFYVVRTLCRGKLQSINQMSYAFSFLEALFLVVYTLSFSLFYWAEDMYGVRVMSANLSAFILSLMVMLGVIQLESNRISFPMIFKLIQAVSKKKDLNGYFD